MTELDVDRPCHPATTHRYRRVGKSDILCCIRCGQGKLDIVGIPLAPALPAPLNLEQLARALAVMAMMPGANECTTTVDCGDYMGGVPTIARFAERIATAYAGEAE
jgi:hypothetical protein